MDPQQPLTYWEQLEHDLGKFKKNFLDKLEFMTFLDNAKEKIESLSQEFTTTKLDELILLFDENINGHGEEANSKLTKTIYDKIKSATKYPEIIYAFCNKLVSLKPNYHQMSSQKRQETSNKIYIIITTLVNSLIDIKFSDTIDSLISPIERFCEEPDRDVKPESVIIALGLIEDLCRSESEAESLRANKYAKLNKVVDNLIKRKATLVKEARIKERALGFYVDDIIRMTNLAISKLVFLKIKHKISKVLKINDTSWPQHARELLHDITRYCQYIQNPLAVLSELQDAMDQFIKKSYKLDITILKLFSELCLELVYLSIYQYWYRDAIENSAQDNELLKFPLPINSQVYFQKMTQEEREKEAKILKKAKSRTEGIKKIDVEATIELMYINYCMSQAYNFLPITHEPKKKLKKMVQFIPIVATPLGATFGLDPTGITTEVGVGFDVINCTVKLATGAVYIGNEIRREFSQRKQSWGYHIIDMRLAQMSFLTHAQLSTSENKEFQLLVELSNLQLEIEKSVKSNYTNWEIDHCALDVLTNIIIYSPYDSIKIAAFFGYEPDFEIEIVGSNEKTRIAQWNKTNSKPDLEKENRYEAINNNILLVLNKKKYWTVSGRGKGNNFIKNRKVGKNSILGELLAGNLEKAKRKASNINVKYLACRSLKRFRISLCDLIIKARKKQITHHGVQKVGEISFEEIIYSNFPKKVKDLVEKVEGERWAYLYETVILHGLRCLNRIFKEIEEGQFTNFLREKFKNEEEIIQAEINKDQAFECLLYHATKEQGKSEADEILKDFYTNYVKIHLKTFNDDYEAKPEKSLGCLKSALGLWRHVDKERYIDKEKKIYLKLKKNIGAYINSISKKKTLSSIVWAIKLIRIALRDDDNIQKLTEIVLEDEAIDESSIHRNVVNACEELIDERENIVNYPADPAPEYLKNTVLGILAESLTVFFSDVRNSEKFNFIIEQVRLLRNALMSTEIKKVFNEKLSSISLAPGNVPTTLFEKVSLWRAPLKEKELVEDQFKSTFQTVRVSRKEGKDFVPIGFLKEKYARDKLDVDQYIFRKGGKDQKKNKKYLKNKSKETEGITNSGQKAVEGEDIFSYQISNTCVNSIEEGELKLHFKADPCFPGEEYMARSFLKLLFGEEMPMEVVWFDPVDKEGNSIDTLKKYPVMISETIEGKVFAKVLEDRESQENEKKEDKRSEKTEIDLDHFGKMIVASIFLRSADAKPDNFILRTVKNGQKITPQLVCVDNELLYSDSYFVEKHLLGSDTTKIWIKNILYCLDEMNIEISQVAKEQFLRKIPNREAIKPFLQLWLSDLANFEQYYLFDLAVNKNNLEGIIERFYYKSGQQENILKSELRGASSLISPVFRKPAQFIACYETLYHLQEFFTNPKNENATYFDLLIDVDPIVGNAYKAAFEKENSNPQSRFDEIAADQYVDKKFQKTHVEGEDNNTQSGDDEPLRVEENSQQESIKKDEGNKKLEEGEIKIITEAQTGRQTAVLFDELYNETKLYGPEYVFTKMLFPYFKADENSKELVTANRKQAKKIVKKERDNSDKNKEKTEKTVEKGGVECNKNKEDKSFHIPVSKKNALKELDELVNHKQLLKDTLKRLKDENVKDINIESALVFGELLDSIDFRQITQKKTQENIISGIITALNNNENIRKLQYLKIDSCGFITEEDLRNILSRLRELRILELNNCQKITNQTLYFISKFCKELQVLKLIKLNSIIKFEKPTNLLPGSNQLVFEKLKRLYIEECENMKEFGRNLKVYYLNKLKISNCSNMEKLYFLDLPIIKHISFRMLPKIEVCEIQNLNVGLSIERLMINDCSEIEGYSDLYSKMPYLPKLNVAQIFKDDLDILCEIITSHKIIHEISTNGVTQIIYESMKQLFDERRCIIEGIRSRLETEKKVNVKQALFRLYVILVGSVKTTDEQFYMEKIAQYMVRKPLRLKSTRENAVEMIDSATIKGFSPECFNSLIKLLINAMCDELTKYDAIGKLIEIYENINAERKKIAFKNILTSLQSEDKTENLIMFCLLFSNLRDVLTPAEKCKVITELLNKSDGTILTAKEAFITLVVNFKNDISEENREKVVKLFRDSLVDEKIKMYILMKFKVSLNYSMQASAVKICKTNLKKSLYGGLVDVSDLLVMISKIVSSLQKETVKKLIDISVEGLGSQNEKVMDNAIRSVEIIEREAQDEERSLLYDSLVLALDALFLEGKRDNANNLLIKFASKGDASVGETIIDKLNQYVIKENPIDMCESLRRDVIFKTFEKLANRSELLKTFVISKLDENIKHGNEWNRIESEFLLATIQNNKQDLLPIITDLKNKLENASYEYTSMVLKIFARHSFVFINLTLTQNIIFEKVISLLNENTFSFYHYIFTEVLLNLTQKPLPEVQEMLFFGLGSLLKNVSEDSHAIIEQVFRVLFLFREWIPILSETCCKDIFDNVICFFEKTKSLKDNYNYRVFETLRTLGQVSSLSVQEAVINKLKKIIVEDENYHICCSAYSVLNDIVAYIPKVEINGLIEMLCQSLSHNKEQIRLYAIKILGEIKDDLLPEKYETVVNDLICVTQGHTSKYDLAREKAKIALGKIGNLLSEELCQRVVKNLIEHVLDNGVMEALDIIGKKIPSLIRGEVIQSLIRPFFSESLLYNDKLDQIALYIGKWHDLFSDSNQIMVEALLKPLEYKNPYYMPKIYGERGAAKALGQMRNITPESCQERVITALIKNLWDNWDNDIKGNIVEALGLIGQGDSLSYRKILIDELIIGLKTGMSVVRLVAADRLELLSTFSLNFPIVLKQKYIENNVAQEETRMAHEDNKSINKITNSQNRSFLLWESTRDSFSIDDRSVRYEANNDGDSGEESPLPSFSKGVKS